MSALFEGKRILVTGGTGSLGQFLTRRLLLGTEGMPESVTVFSRDEAKQHQMRLDFMQRPGAGAEIIYENGRQHLKFMIGDVRDYSTMLRAVRDADIIFAAAALKQVPSCEYYPWEACRTNIEGAENLVRVIADHRPHVQTVVGISTDKACKPVCVMGMTKAIQERVYIEGNLRAPKTRFVCARFGNVLASRGSALPLFLDQIAAGGPVTITSAKMTRFLLTMDEAVDTVFAAVRSAAPGDIYVPTCPSTKITDLVACLIGDGDTKTVFTGVRPGEKFHEILLSEEEAARTVEGEPGYYALRSMLPELSSPVEKPALVGDYSSAGALMDRERLAAYLAHYLPSSMGETFLDL